MDSVYTHLSNIAEPRDLHRFSDKELLEVAQEVRQAILDHVSKTGGHLSSNLGTVELTVAMYAAYDIPPDKVVWDTGHQAYPHKILTGRLEQFPTLRKHGGMSGFLRRSEHELDIFGAGHAGTAVSAALGFALARDTLGTKERVVAVAGDASIATGMSWEALNHAGELHTDMAVVLNDNRMSIAPNVGALTNYLAKLRSRPSLQTAAARAKRVVEKMPEPVAKMAAGLRHGITHYLAPEETGTVFEEIGWEYIGPVDGHDLLVLLDVFRNVRELPGPVFVHAITTKGKGLPVAEEDSRKWHGVVPFDLERCELAKTAGPITFTQAFGAAAIEAAESDPAVVAITAAMPDGTGLTEFAKQFPNRYFDTGIAEPHAVTMSAGMAAGGLKPFVAIYSSFLQRAYDGIVHDVALQKLPVRFFLDRAGLVGDDGPTHHGVFDLSYLLHIPNLTIAAPRDTTELMEMVRWSVGFNEGPLAVRYPRGSGDDRLPEARTSITVGRAEVLSQGSDLAFIAIGSGVAPAWEAATRLKERGMSVGVVNARFAKPLDEETILTVARNVKRLVTVEENVESGGFGEAVAAVFRRAGLTTPLEIIALPDSFVEHGTQPILRHETGIDADGIVMRVLGEANLASMATQ
ncbi:1-deoxy-D-xylulose-5-phosphate synthase [bacterium]|nr:MAG: 1-deoxy-D-xylulose-5-phosphate synthase [bacterium]